MKVPEHIKNELAYKPCTYCRGQGWMMQFRHKRIYNSALRQYENKIESQRTNCFVCYGKHKVKRNAAELQEAIQIWKKQRQYQESPQGKEQKRYMEEYERKIQSERLLRQYQKNERLKKYIASPQGQQFLRKQKKKQKCKRILTCRPCLEELRSWSNRKKTICIIASGLIAGTIAYFTAVAVFK